MRERMFVPPNFVARQTRVPLHRTTAARTTVMFRSRREKRKTAKSTEVAERDVVHVKLYNETPALILRTWKYVHKLGETQSHLATHDTPFTPSTTKNTHLRENFLRDPERVAGVERRRRVAHEAAAGRHVWPDVSGTGRGG